MFSLAKRITALSACLSFVVAASIHAQVANPQKGADPNAQAPQVPEDLWQLLADWETGSAKVQELHGRHVRRAYDHTFGIEKIAQGEFWYESPDKGRIDVQSVQITPQMLAARNEPDAQVQKLKGKPYELKSDDPARWICDGEKVFDIDDAQKVARIGVLPPEIRGKNIMNSPLPFLFGMPRDEALKRFNIRIMTDYRPKYAVVHLFASPRMRKDADNWSEAEILLDTNTFLPTGVKLVNPAGTKDTRYTFQDMEINQRGRIQDFLKGKPWDPKLDKDYKIHMMKPEDGEPVANQGNGPMIPNVVGKAHDVATNMLIQVGIPRENIKKQNAGPAPRANLTYLVRDQQPKAGSTLDVTQEIVLMIFDKPVNAEQQSDSGARQSGNGVAARP